jgi:triosephosphate isomerase
MTLPNEPKTNPLQNFVAGIVIKVVTSDQVQAAVKDILGQLITERILPLVPVAVGAAVKAAVDEMVVKIPGIEGVVDAVKATESARNILNELIPDIPILGNLADFWGPRADG